MADFLIKRPMLICGIACVLIAIAGFYSGTMLFVFGGIIFSALLYLVIKRKEKRLWVTVITVVIMLLSTVLNLVEIKHLNSLDGKSCSCELTVLDVTYRGDGFCIAETEVIKSDLLPRGTKLSIFFKAPEPIVGQCFSASLRLSKVDNSKYKASSYSKRVYLNGALSEATLLERSDAVLSTVHKVREYIRKTLFSRLGYSEASTLCALIFGDKSYFTNQFQANVTAAGVSHVMVVSGMHLAIIVSLIDKLVKKMFYNRYVKALYIALTVLLLTALCGFTMSMLRAGITYLLMALALAVGRESTPENTLGAALTFILIVSPFAIFSVALQLSLLATFGILVVALPVISYVKNKGFITFKPLLSIFKIVVMTLSALILTLPVTVYVFGSVSIVAPITSLLISVAVTITLTVTVLGLAVNLVFPFLADAFFIVSRIITAYINAVINKLGSLPFSAVSVEKYCAVFAVLLIAIIFMLLIACKNHINVIKLEEMRNKIIKEGGKTLKWR